MLNCDASITVYFIFTEPLTLCNGQRIFNVVFISKDHVGINLPFSLKNQLSGKHFFKDIKGVTILGYLVKWTIINKCSYNAT